MRPQDLLRDDIDPRDIKRAVPTVKVGFEFEICIPQQVLQSDDTPQYSTDHERWIRDTTLETFFDRVLNDDNPVYHNGWLGPIDNIFTMRRLRKVAHYGTTKIGDAYRTWAKDRVEAYKTDLPRRTRHMLDTVRSTIAALRAEGQERGMSGDYEGSIKIFYDEVGLGGISLRNLLRLRNPPPLTAEQIDRIRAAAHRRWINTTAPEDDLWSRIKIADDMVRQYTDDRLRRTGPNPQREHFLSWVRETWGTTRIDELLSGGWRVREPSGEPDLRWQQLWWYVTPGARWPGGRRGGVYDREIADWLKDRLEPQFGTVEVFDRYHERAKQLDRWYIEPDGSLRPREGDYAAEVVGPPQPVSEALGSLRRFVEFALAHGIYTNASTGLHINVSVPGNIDVLKLALFSGDVDALKRFGREGSTYAKSIMNALRGSGDVGRLVPQEMTPRDRATVQSIATNIARDHFSSVNYGGNYVSFRQAGGDYLSQLSDVLIVLRNFVRAMVLAADPHLAQQEYLQKLTRLAHSAHPPLTPPQRFTRGQIGSDGIPALRVVLAPLKDTASAQQLAMLLKRGVLLDFTSPHVWMDAQPDGVNAFIGDGDDLRQETIEQLRNTGDTVYVATVVASNARDTYSVANRAYEGEPNGVYKPSDARLLSNRVAVARVTPLRIRRGDALYTTALRTLLSGGVVGPRGPLPETVDGQPRQHSAILRGIVAP